MQILTPTDTAHALPYPDLVRAVERAMRQLAQGEINAPDRMVVPIDSSSVLLSMPAIAKDIGVTKLITVHAENARRGLPAIQGEVIVFDTGSGRRLALLDGPTVTARRTAAVTLLGIETLARNKPASALLIGAGAQAKAHADALVEYFGLARFLVAGRDKARVQEFCDEMSRSHPAATFSAASADDVLARCPEVDVAIALTTSRSAVIPVQLPAKTLAIGVGAFKPDMAELPAELLRSRQVVVDHVAGAQHEAGDLLQAGIDWSKVRDLAQVLANGIREDGLPPVLKTVGHAAWDLAAARVAVQQLGLQRA